MKISDLQFEYPEELVAVQPARPTRVMWVVNNGEPMESTLPDLIQNIPPGDVLVINNTKVLKRRVFSEDQSEILFLDQVEERPDSNLWKVLYPSKKFKVGDKLKLPNGFTMTLLEKGRPQIVEVTPAVSDLDFSKFAELPLPPYIQKARGERHNRNDDQKWYQPSFAKVPGSMASPTASLHFTNDDILKLVSRGVHIVEVTLHVGLGTFLPVTVENLKDHVMHSEEYEISKSNWELLKKAKSESHKIWALGTTSARVLESVARTEKLFGSTDILLMPGIEFKMVDRLLTNFHQPESTLLALVAGFSSLETVKKSYAWAIARKFRLFSYGDLSVWIK